MTDPKWIEIRDKGTFIPALAIAINCEDNYLARRAGFGHERAIQLVYIGADQTHNDAFEWMNSRTLRTVHLHLEEHWDSIQSGDVVDVEFLLGETLEPKKSEQELFS